MSPDLVTPGSVRSAAVVNEDIHTLMRETGGWLWGPTRERYQQLRDEWVEADHVKARPAA